MDLGLSKKLVIVTGAARGIGASTAQAFINEGARVLLIDLNKEVKKLADKIGGSSLVCDLTDINADDKVATAANKLGGASILPSPSS